MTEDISPPSMKLTESVLTNSVTVEQKSVNRTRMLYIDNMRVILISLVIVGHMAITYGAPLGDWYYREQGGVGVAFEVLTTLLLGIGAAFLLGLFYMIAGYFTPRPYDRKGAKQFIIDRLVRLGIPLIIYATIINSLVTYWAAVHGGYVGSFPAYVRTHVPDLTRASVGPLWFVEALLIFSLVYALGHLIFDRNPHNSSIADPMPVPTDRSITFFALGLGFVTFLVRIWAPFGWWWEPLHLEPAHFPQYAAFFTIGIIAYRNDWFNLVTTKQARLWAWLALILVPVLPILAVAAGALEGEFDPAIAGGFTWLSLVYSMWEAFIGVSLVIAVLVWFRERINHQGRLAQALSPTAYTVYVIHPLVIVPLALGLSGIALNLGIKFILFAPLAVVLCFLVGYLLRMIPIVRRVL